MPIKTIIRELLWFISGETTIANLVKHGVHIWDGDTTREALDKRDLRDYEVGETGPIYGYQWRYWNKPYRQECESEEKSPDQLANIIRNIKYDPFSRRHVLIAWNPSQLEEMCLPPCHFAVVFVVSPGSSGKAKYLSVQITMRSGDTFLGIPFNIASYALLTHMIANLCRLRAKEISIIIADCHVYKNHIDAINKQLTMNPRGFPTVRFKKEKYNNIDSFDVDDFIIEDYYPNEQISAKLVNM